MSFAKRLFGRRRPEEGVSFVVIVEGLNRDEAEARAETQRLSDMWHRLLTTEDNSSGSSVVGSIAKEYPGTDDSDRFRLFLREAARGLNLWYKVQRRLLEEEYGRELYVSKFRICVCRGDAVSAPEGEADIVAIIDVLAGRVSEET